MASKTHIELDEDGSLRVNGFDELANKCLPLMLKLFFFVVPLTIGFYEYNTLMESPLMNLSAVVMGFCYSVISWLFALIIPWFIFGKEDFPIKVFRLYSNIDFSISIAFVFVLLPLSRFLTRAIIRTVTSYRYRRYIFIVSSITVIACISSLIDYISSSYNPYVFFFNITVTGIIYFILIMHKKEIIKPRMRPRTINNYFNNSLNQEDINPENLL